MVETRVEYSWTITTPGRYDYAPAESQHLPAQAVDNCWVYVQLIRVSPDYCCVVIRKTNLSPIKVSITISGCNSYVLEEDEWKDATESPNFHCSANLTVYITCNIIWILPEARAAVIDPPRALVLPAENFLMSSSLSDVTIVIGKEEVLAHKLILCGYSSVLSQMLSTPMKEAETNRIAIEDVDLDTMKTVLTFLYKGKCEALSEVPVACKAFAVAHKYDIKHLQDTCVYYLHQQVNAKNVIDILELAELYEHEQLKQICWDVVMKNKKDIMLSDQFKDLCMASRGVLDQCMIKMVNACP